MSKTESERLADGDYTAADYTRNDPHSIQTTRQDWGEFSWDEYAEGHKRTKQEQAERERWALQWGGE